MITFGGTEKAAGALALMLALAPIPAAAQSAPDFSLPGSRPTTNPRAQGPVDEDAPVVRTAPRPTPTPPPVVVTPTPSTSQTVAAQPRGSAAPSATPRSTPAVTQRPVAQPPRPGTTIAPAPQASGALVTPTPSDQPAPTISPLPTTPTVAATDSFALPPVADSSAASSSGWYWPWVAGAATLLAALFGVLLWRRRKPAVKLLEFERPIVPQPSAEPDPAPIPQPVAAPVPAAAQTSLSINLEARRMNASLVATTLNYVLTLTNTTDQPLTALAVEGDMIAAHGSLPTEKQIANDNHRLELRHALVNLAPGESAEFTGDFRLPLATLVPIRAGDAAYFIPLARWRVEASNAAGAQVVQVQTFVVGELPEQPGAALRPFRLDLGPRTYSRIGQRAVS